MPRTVQDYANAVPLGRVDRSDDALPEGRIAVQQVEVRGRHVVATMRWSDYPHPVSHALLPEDVLIWGGDLPIEEATLEMWAEQAVIDLGWAAGSSLMSSRRSWSGGAIELVETEPVDPRYSETHLLGTASSDRWSEVAQYFHPRVPPPAIDQWRRDGSLISWHQISLSHDHVLPVYGHGAVRWVDEGVASFDYLDLAEGLPETFGLLTLAEAIHQAAAAGAHTIRTSVEVAGAELLGFRDDGAFLTVDNRFLDLDHDGVETFVSRTRAWTPPASIASDIDRADRATYYAK